MTDSTDQNAEAWTNLSGLPEEERTARMAERFTEMLSFSEEERAARMETIIRAVSELSDEEMAELSRSRLLAWLSMDKDSAKRIAEDFQMAMDGVPGRIAMKHVTMDQTVSLNFSHEQITALAEMDPKVFRSMPGAVVDDPIDSAPPAAEASKPWWRFW